MSHKPRPPIVPAFFVCLGLAVAALILWRLGPYWDYYLLPIGQRPLHVQHGLLRSSGAWGLPFGLIGTVLMFLNLTYLVRRWLVDVEWLGSLRSWMSFHVFTGIIGPLLIVCHSSLIFRSPNATIAFLALMAVVGTGLMGRYIYAHTPRSVKGKELELSELTSRLGAYRAELQKLGMPVDVFDTWAVPDETRGGAVIPTLISFLRSDYVESPEHRKLRELVSSAPNLGPSAPQILAIGGRYFRERQWLERYQELRSFMSTWRFFHRWFAIVMLVLASFHIMVAVRMGDLGIAQSLRDFLSNWRH